MNKYQELAGCDTREEYLDMLAEEYGMDYEIVSEIAFILGENEDFDGLVVFCQDHGCY